VGLGRVKVGVSGQEGACVKLFVAPPHPPPLPKPTTLFKKRTAQLRKPARAGSTQVLESAVS
jgi:hypothetical protein